MSFFFPSNFFNTIIITVNEPLQFTPHKSSPYIMYMFAEMMSRDRFSTSRVPVGETAQLSWNTWYCVMQKFKKNPNGSVFCKTIIHDLLLSIPCLSRRRDLQQLFNLFLEVNIVWCLKVKGQSWTPKVSFNKYINTQLNKRKNFSTRKHKVSTFNNLH